MYTDVKYSNSEETIIEADNNGVKIFIPCSLDNNDYNLIMNLVANNELSISPYVENTQVIEISMRQARLELLSQGLLDQVKTIVANAGQAAQIEWEYATAVYRSSPLINYISSQLNPPLSNTQINALFNSASQR